MIKKSICLLAAIILLAFTVMPAFAAPSEENVSNKEKNDKGPAKPYEKIIDQNGPWYTESIEADGSSTLAVGYDGSFAIDQDILFNTEPTSIKVKDDMSLTGIYVPYTGTVATALAVTLTDKNGNIYGPFAMEGMPAIAISVADGTDVGAGAAVANQMIYSYAPKQNLVLPKGEYTLSLSDPSMQVRTEQTGPQGAYLLKGMYAPAYEKYLSSIKADDSAKKDGEDTIGNTFEKNPYGVAEKPPVPKPAFFTLEEPATVDEVMINTINGGSGATPGIIAILNEAGEVIYSDQSYGVKLADVPNGMWAIAPEIVLPAGTYQIGLSDPAAITYDKKGDPLFYINISEPKTYRYDYTGTYKVNLETYKTSTLMGPVNPKTKSFSLENFELSIIDHGDYLELIGKYENMPFSQRAEIIDVTDESITGQFEFAMDLSGLPAKTKIGANVQFVLSKAANGPAQFTLKGNGTYERAASKDKGADSNTYEVLASGVMVQNSLPAYVAAALGGSLAAGSVPGPGSPGQAATGLLFPPLVGLVAHVIQEAIKKAAEKKKAEEGPKKYSKEWYRKQHPGASDETLAWIMMGDALANSDEPDADPEAGSDAEGSGSSETDSSEGTEGSEGTEAEAGEEEGSGEEESESEGSSETSTEEIPEDKPKPLTERDFMSEEEKAELDAKAAKEAADKAAENNNTQENKEEIPENKPWADKPETMTLETGIDGRTTTYELDPNTGEYVNPLTGGVLDMEVYEKVVKPNLSKEQAWMDEERRKIAAGETAQDKALDQMLKDQQKKADEQKWQDYKKKIMDKYGAASEKEVDEIITAQNAAETDRAAKWNMIGKVAAVGEVGATVTGAVADATIDFMGDRLGVAGKVIRAGYKVTKAVASDVATSGSETNLNTIKGALIKGSADAGSDFVDSKIIKGALTIGAETVGSYTQSDSGKEWDAISEGFVGGVVKVGSGLITDKIAGDGFGSDMSIGKPLKGFSQVTHVDGNKFVTTLMSTKDARNMAMDKINNQIKQSATKIGSSLLDSYVVKPYGTDNLAGMAKNLPKK